MVKMYEREVDMQKLKLQLQLLQDAVKSVSLDGIQIREVTQIQSVCDVFNEESSLKKFLTEIHKLLKVYLTILVTSYSLFRTELFSLQACEIISQKFNDSKLSKPLHATACT